MRLLIIGGTGAFSGRITEEAVQQGHQVLLFNRARRPQPPGIRVPVIVGERAAIRQHAAEIAAFSPEAVIDSICFKPAEAEDLVSLFPTVRRVVFISSVDAYGEDVGAAPVTEDRPASPVTEYGKNKLACEKLLLEGLGPRVTVFRPSHILGRGFLTTSLWGRSPYLVDRLRKGKPIPAIDGGRNVMTPVYAGDIARWVMRALENPAADGEVFNAVGPEIITQARYYHLIAAVLGVTARLVAVPSHVFRQYFATPPQFNWHRPYSCRKAALLLGYQPAFGPEAMLRETVEHMLAHGLVRDSDQDPFDDRLVALLLQHEAELGDLLAQKKR
ncbi:MAG: NAD-dependent epimerase/dehydratase family protein [Armatimonadota bacterium]|nr:NAD-dependent epimerase/dehydratase family protein [Armatimonadota bacterium]